MKARTLTKCALMAALLCVVSPISVPLGAIPLSLATAVIYITSIILTPTYAIFSVLVYIMTGALGLPVFSGFSGGISVLLGPTGGFIAGYALCAFIASYFANKDKENRLLCLFGMLLGTMVIYLAGSLWYIFITGASDIWKICILPFIPADVLKILVVLAIYPKLKTIKNVL